MPGGSRRNADEAFITALACGATIDKAARSAGISASTATRRMKDPAFRQRLQEAKDGIVQRTSATLRAAANEAVKALLTLVQPPASDSVRLGAAKAIIELGMKTGEVTELHERIAALEAQVASPATSPGSQ